MCFLGTFDDTLTLTYMWFPSAEIFHESFKNVCGNVPLC